MAESPEAGENRTRDEERKTPGGDERLLRRLAQRIHRESCVLVLGPDVATHPEDPELPLTRALARELCEELDVAGRPNWAADNLRQSAELLSRKLGDRDALLVLVERFYKRFEAATTDFHRHLAELPFSLCISTTPDRFMLNAFRSAGKHPSAAYYHFRGEPRLNPSATSIGTAVNPLVYYLYGRYEEPYSLVVTETDLIDFLVRIIKQTPPLPDKIRGILGNQETTFLFAGFGFRDWYVRVLLQVLSIYGHPNKPVALEAQTFFDDPSHVQAVTFFSGDHAVDFKALTWTEFAAGLGEMYASVAGQKDASPVLPADAPRVFLCYASEDRDFVERIGTDLTALGLAVWRDKQNLRGGDDWDRKLPDVIEHAVDYFVACRSAAWRRPEGYFNKELDVALDRQRRFRAGLNFVIPVTIEPSLEVPPDQLARFHEVDITSDEGLRALAKGIFADWQERQSGPREGQR